MSRRSSLLALLAAVTGLAAVWAFGPAARSHRHPASAAPRAVAGAPQGADETQTPTAAAAADRAPANDAAPAADPAPALAHSPLPARYDVPSQAEQFRRIETWNEAAATRVLAAQRGDVVELPLFDGRVLRARVTSVHEAADGQRIVAGELQDGVAGTFTLGAGADGVIGGLVFPTAGQSAFVVEAGRDGALRLVERWKQSVVCTEFPRSVAGDAALEVVVPAAAESVAGAEALLSSRPEAVAVAYLDFDGETVTEPLWNGGATIVAEHSGLSPAQIVEAWRRVAEDFRPFNIDVTTNRARYDAAPVKQRMRCIVTPTSGWYGGVGGVAYTASWRQAGGVNFTSTVPCWVFSNMLAMSGRYVGEACSHEIGHTLGLSHDGAPGQTYYAGHGAGGTGWAPIMGIGYYQNLVQWSKGEYSGANNLEDDLAIITSVANKVTYADDEAGDTPADAAVLKFAADGTVATSGVVGRTGEADAYAFNTSGGAVNFTFTAEVGGDEGVALPDLDARVRLYDANGQLVSTVAPDYSLAADCSANLAAGTYYLVIDGTGVGTLPGGYGNYGSLGRYALVGSVPTVANAAPVVFGRAAVTTVAGTSLAYAIEATGQPTSYSATGLPAGMTLNAATGAITGAPTTAGEYAVVLRATNAAGTGTRTVTFTVTSVLGAHVESPVLPWTTGGGAAWFEDYTAPHDGVTSLRSGVIGANGTSWIETTVTGAGSVSFWWKVSSEANGDYLRFTVDGVEIAKISGTVGWVQVTQTIAAGTHALRWNYTKNSKTNAGTDNAWLDGVTYTKAAVAPVITSAASARAVIGRPFSYRITASNSPTSFGAANLPAGLALNAATGDITGVPQASAQRGLVETTVSASNTGGTGSANVALEVVTGFTAWTEDAALAGDGALAAGDPDGDGVANLLEYAFARSATVAETPSTGLPLVTLVGDGAAAELVAVFTIPANRPDLRYTVQVSSDLVTWEAGHAYGVGVTAAAGELPTEEVSRAAVSGGEEIVVRDRNLAGSSRRFVRVVVTAE